MDGRFDAEGSEAALVDALPWEVRFPGRFRAEAKALDAQGVEWRVDQHRLAQGQLAVEVKWPLDAETMLELLAIYPDSFPYARPQVFLRGGLADLPKQHVSPREGNLCLLGRDTEQWNHEWTLSRLLSEQLEGTIRGSDNEDPQAEPVEVWWNTLGTPGSYCLVDSAWTVGEARHGKMKLRFRSVHAAGPGRQPEASIRGYISEIRNGEGEVLQTWQAPLPQELSEDCSEVDIQWIRLDEPILPNKNFAEQLTALRKEKPTLASPKTHHLKQGKVFETYAILAEGDVSFGHEGLTWVMPFATAPIAAFKGKGKKQVMLTTLPVLRAGRTDIGFRVPAAATLHDKRILIIGAGAIGAPLGLELARNGCGHIDLLEHDRLEPGNTIRWPLGAEFWGRTKLQALREAITRSYPACKVRCHEHFVGSAHLTGNGDEAVLGPLMAEVDLVIDASTSHSVTALMCDWCREANVPFITMAAMPDMTGGFVARHTASGGCYNCLQHAWHHGDLERPSGWRNDAALTQPAGCAERTFFGASYDLQELSLQTARLAVATLGGDQVQDSIVQTVDLRQDGSALPPSWRSEALPHHPQCSCHLRR